VAPSLARFHDRVALVTGGASGIGLATVRRLSAEGARTWIGDLDGAAGARAAAATPNTAWLQLDVANEDSVADSVAAILAAEGRIDVLVNNAGVVLGAPVWDTTLADWNLVLSVNLTGAFLCTRAVLPGMVERRSGAVVSTASDAALVGWPDQAAYCASKAGLAAFTRAAALDAAPYGVRVNCVCPAFTDTPLLRSWVDGTSEPESAMAEAAGTQPLGRVARPEEIAAAIAYLASDEASFVTGVALPVDGGVTAA
jgi:meso-butanediol dehydrogenase/(S,S)-butanediol dehydrogenase/diacetyl reductase